MEENFEVKKVENSKWRDVVLVSLGTSIILILILSALAWNFRASIFDYLAQEYLKEVSEQNLNSTTLSQDSFVIEAVKRANPSVVSILVTKEVPVYETYLKERQLAPFGNLFPGLRFNVPEQRQNGTEEREVGSGSGFFATKDGLIVTNRHVVAEEDVEYTVFTNDGRKHSAEVVARDPILDIALIKIERDAGEDLFPVLDLGDSDSIAVGQSVIAIGNALGEFRNTVSVGIVSALSRSITAGNSRGESEFLDSVIQTDAAINPGNSGGPLLDLRGNVIGVNVALAQGSQNVGFALPINSVKGAIESVKNTGKIVRPFLGVRYMTIDAEIAEQNDLEVEYGALVKSGPNKGDLAVIPGGPADKAGIVENDIILEIDGKKLEGNTSLASIIRSKSVGDTVTLKIFSKGSEKTVSATLEAAKE